MRYQSLWFTMVSTFLLSAVSAFGQSAALTGTVKDSQDASIPAATVTLTNAETKVAQTTQTDASGNYEFPVIRPGSYQLKVEKAGFKTFQQNDVVLAVTQRGRVDARLDVGEASTILTVEANASGVQTESSSLGTIVENKKIVEIPLNGRFFLDLALLTAGTVVPSTSNRTFLAAPSGIGISGINASGTREDSTNYLFDGINLSDMVQNQITFQPNIDMIQEFKVQTNAFSAEYGRNAGIIINAVSKSGTNGIHGSAFEFVRNEIFDAKNFFDKAGPIAPFKRNIYGYSVGGPVVKNKVFFFHSYEGRQGREVATLNAPVPTEEQRAGVTNPIIKKLLDVVPRANSATGSFFQGSNPRQRKLNQYTGRIDASLTTKDVLFGTFIINRDERTEPTLQGNNLPGFGDSRPAKRALVALGYTRILSPNITNEMRAGMNRVYITFTQVYPNSPSEFGITSPSNVFPQFIVAGGGGGGPAFGGISGFPQGRGDTTFQYNDTLSWVKGRQSIKFGAEFRRVRNNNFNYGTGGVINFATMASFLAGTPSSATETALAVTPAFRANGLGLFAQDDIKINKRLALNLGVRWEYNGVPNEIHNRIGVYDFGQNKVIPIGSSGGVEQPYQPQYTNFGPRIGLSYDPFGKGRTVVRGGVGFYYDQPVLNILSGLASNPPFSASVNNTSNISLATPFAVPPGGSSAIAAVDPNFKSGRVLSYNTNIQHEMFGTVFQVSYVGSQGRHLRIFGDLNQGILGVRPITGFSSIAYQQSVSNSNYNGLWISAEKRFAKGLTFQTSYTVSKSIDNNSVGSSNAQAQDYRNLAAERALSDFDARQRFVLSGVYQLQLRGQGAMSKRLIEGWSVSPIVNLQSGNPFSPIIASADARGSLQAFNRPFLNLGVPLYLGQGPSGFVNPAAFTRQATGFGNAGRNILTSPGFQDVDFSIAKLTQIKERVSVQFRAEAFNLLNHPNFGQPVNNLLAANFGQITATRTARGDLGSSRQLQLGIKLVF